MTKKTFSLFSLAIIITLALAVAKPANAGWYVNSLGWLVYEPDTQVLGEEDEQKMEGKEERREKPKQETGKHEVEYFDAGKNAWIKAKTEDGKTKTEIKTVDGREIKMETETEREKYRLKLEAEAGVLKLEAETEDGQKTRLGEDREIEIEERRDNKIRVATGSGEKEMVISRNQVRARTNFPLSIDLETNELIVTTPAGAKRVTILPDQAIARLLENNLIDRIDPENEEELELTETEDGTAAYAVAGESDQKFLGFMPVKIRAKYRVSAETGEVLSSEKPLVTRLLDLFSF